MAIERIIGQVRHQKFNTWLAAVRKLLENPLPVDRNNDLYSLAWDIMKFSDAMYRDVEQVRSLLDVLRLLRVSKGSGRGALEEHSFRVLNRVMFDCCSVLRDAGVVNIKAWDIPDTLSVEVRSQCEIAVILCEFAVESIAFSRPRDSLAGNRRSYSFEMLGEASRVFNIPESVIDQVLKIIKSKRGSATSGALRFLDSYFEAQQIHVPDDVEILLISFVNRTDSRGLAVGALNILVECGNISEFTALNHIDDWKERNYR